MSVLVFSATFFPSIFFPDKYFITHMFVKLEVRTEMHVGFHVKYLLLVSSYFTKMQMVWQIVVEFPNIKFCTNLLIRS
jgi:hypothetical protein